MKQAERNELIARYSAGYDEVVDALKDFPSESLTAHPLPGKWSAREIVHHLADSETTSAIRLRRLLAEDSPVIQGYDQDVYAQKLRYNERDMQPSLEAFRFARASTVPLLEILHDEDWKREGVHTESGPYGVETWLKIYADHAHNHASQIRRLHDSGQIMKTTHH